MKVISGAALRFYFSTFILIMPLTSKRNLKNPFDCPNCTQIFQTRGGLSQHYRKKHRPLTDLYETNLGDNDAIPLLPDIIGVPPTLPKFPTSYMINHLRPKAKSPSVNFNLMKMKMMTSILVVMQIPIPKTPIWILQ